MLQLYGIRHHGPGSARALLNALEADPPDCLLIELPADADGLLKHLSHSNTQDAMEPPVALLVYDEKDLGRAAYLPFATFSPEWQALHFAIARNIPVRCMDLPMEINFSLDELEEQERQALLFSSPEERQAPDEANLRRDPLGRIARLAGYSDGERWWELAFERQAAGADVFAVIAEMMTELRGNAAESPRTLLREAHMRQTIRKALKDGYSRLAVICGAWHVPALQMTEKTKAAPDQALLKGIKKTKTTATWISWSYERMTFDSGYGAGIQSPAWYEMLFHHRRDASAHWMIAAARLLRKEDISASSAHVIEAVRLAEALASLRELAVPGLDELREAAVATICEGVSLRLELIDRELVTGSSVGKVPAGIPMVPLHRDILQAIKATRLTKYWENPAEEWLGATAAEPQGGIDLREESGRQKSRLLHRLHLLEIPWGTPAAVERHRTAGSFREYWKMKWVPEVSLHIIGKSAWGSTVEEASTRFATKKSAETGNLPDLTRLLKQVLDADLPAVFDPLMQKIENVAALSSDVYHLMETLPPLSQIVRYGNARGTAASTLEQLLEHLVPRICIGLPAAVLHLDEEASREALEKIMAVHRALGVLNTEGYYRQWYASLGNIAGSLHTNPILTGACTRILFDKKIIGLQEMSTRMRFSLSSSTPPLQAAQWLEGFLQGSGLLLLHHAELWQLLDNWVDELGEEHFREALPLLRRTFSRFSERERQMMLDLARQGQVATPAGSALADEERASLILPTVKMLLGL